MTELRMSEVWQELKKAKLGQSLGLLRDCCSAVYGGVAWPGKGPGRDSRPGCAVVVARSRLKHFDSYDVCLLDEYESVHMRDLVRQCGALDFKYEPMRWIGDSQNDAADYFIRKMNDEQQRQGRRFSLAPTPLLDLDHLYETILEELRRLRNPKCRQLELKDSKILNYLRIQEGEATSLELGDYPAIEALAFAVLEVLKYDKASEAPRPKREPYNPLWSGLRRRS